MGAKRPKILRGVRGASLMEVMVGIGIVAIMVAVVAQFSGTFSRSSKPVTLQRACEQHAQRVVQTIQEETYYQHISNFVPDGAGALRIATAYASNAGTTALPTPGDRWLGGGANYTISSDSGANATGATLQNFQLIKGSIRTLTAIYNNGANAAIRCAFGDYAPLTGLAFSSELAATGADADIRFRPYDRATGADFCPAGGLFISPAPANPTGFNSSAIAANSGSQTPPANRQAMAAPPAIPAGMRIGNRGVGRPQLDTGATSAEYGIEVTVRVSYTNNGENKSCQVTQKFEYPADRTAPAAPTARIISNSTIPQGNCAVPARNVVLQIGVDATMEFGSQFICKDLSWRMTWPTGPAQPGYIPCRPNAAPFNTIDAHQPLTTAENSAARVARWVPCDLLSQCGVLPTASYTDSTGAAKASPNATATNGHYLRLTYNNLPKGCVLNFETVATDTAGNISARSWLETTNVGINAFNAALAVTNRLNVIMEPTCGSPVTVNQNWPAPYNFGATIPRGIVCNTGNTANWTAGDLAAYPNGYYTCRAGGGGPCCVGVGCTPNN